MAWQVGPTAAKYKTAEHRNLRDSFVRKIKAGQRVECAETVCLFTDRAITETDGRLPQGLNVAHADDGITYKGASHRACNLHDAAVRANLRSRGLPDGAQRATWTL